eukprot:scaffold161863_cov17-Tisochrysis_lutea.AAC.3
MQTKLCLGLNTHANVVRRMRFSQGPHTTVQASALPKSVPQSHGHSDFNPDRTSTLTIPKFAVFLLHCPLVSQ